MSKKVFGILITVLIFVIVSKFAYSKSLKSSLTDKTIPLPSPSPRLVFKTPKLIGNITENIYTNDKYGFSLSLQKNEIVVYCPKSAGEETFSLWILKTSESGIPPNSITYKGCESEGPSVGIPVMSAVLDSNPEDASKITIKKLSDLTGLEHGSWIKTSKMTYASVPAYFVQTHILFFNPYPLNENKPELLTIDRNWFLVVGKKAVFSIPTQYQNRNLTFAKE